MNKVSTHSRRITALPSKRALLSCVALLAALLPMRLASQSSVLPEVQVTAAPIPDYEFDSGRNGVYCTGCNFGDGNRRFVFSDQNNNLWLGKVDSATGAFVPP